MAKKAIVVATQDSKWHVQRGVELVLVEFKKGEELEVGKDVPAAIAADMLKHGYAVDPDAEKAKAKAKAEAAEAEAKAKREATKDPAKENKAGDPANETK